MSQAQIQAIAATILAVLTAVVAVFVEPWVAEAGLIERTLAAILGAVGLFFVFLLAESRLKAHYYRKILGDWHYVTLADSEHRNENFGWVRFFFDDGGALAYEVKLYEDFETMTARGLTQGEAVSDALGYNKRRDWINILYSLTLYDESDPRRGWLVIASEHDDKRQGTWARVVDDAVLSRGKMYAARPETFATSFEAWTRREMERTQR